MKALNIIALALVVIGALNWGMIGIFGFNVVGWLFGMDTIVTRIIYTLVGIAGIYSLYLFKPVAEGSHPLTHSHA
jgi:uncharacterized membrane protein YuzA (DUF378 family)